jgi:hypothetical protein
VDTGQAGGFYEVMMNVIYSGGNHPALRVPGRAGTSKTARIACPGNFECPRSLQPSPALGGLLGALIYLPHSTVCFLDHLCTTPHSRLVPV